jgi:tripartite-type tricarboxylate transporter receptor subunit TctC
MKLRSVLMSLFALGVAAAPVVSSAQTYPEKPIRVIVPYEPGGVADVLARIAAPGLGAALGQTILVENRSGASGQIGAQLVARSAPDGYTLMSTNGGTHILALFAFKSIPYHPVRDFTPVTAATEAVLSVAASAAFPPNTMGELIEYAKRNPDKVSYGAAGIGGLPHLAMEQVNLLAGTRMMHVNYKGGAPIALNLVSGQLDLGVLPVSTLGQQLRAGKVKILAMFSSKRSPSLPGIPTAAEVIAGYRPLEGSGVWIFGPANLPAPLLSRISAALVKVLNSTEVREKLEATGQQVVANSPAEFSAQIAGFTELAGRLFKAAKIEPE